MQTKKPFKETHVGLRPLSMAQKTFDIVMATAFLSELGGVIIAFALFFNANLSVYSFLIALILPPLIFIIAFKIYEAKNGLEPPLISAQEKPKLSAYDKAFVVVFLIAYFVLPIGGVLTIEAVLGNASELIVFTLIFIGVIIFCVLFYFPALIWDYRRFNAYKKEYLKNNAEFLNKVEDYIKANLNSYNVKILEKSVVFVEKKPNYVYFDDYNCDYRESQAGYPFPFPFVIRKRFKKSRYKNCFIALNCYEQEREALTGDYNKDGEFIIRGVGKVNFIEFYVSVNKGVFSDDLQRRIDYNNALNAKKPMFLEYLNEKYEHSGYRFAVIEILNLLHWQDGSSDEFDLNGDVFASVVKTDKRGFYDMLQVEYIDGRFIEVEGYD